MRHFTTVWVLLFIAAPAMLAASTYTRTQHPLNKRAMFHYEDFYTSVDPDLPEETLKKKSRERLKTIASIEALLDKSDIGGAKISKARSFNLRFRLAHLLIEEGDYRRWKKDVATQRRHSNRALTTLRHLLAKHSRNPKIEKVLAKLVEISARQLHENTPLYLEQLNKKFPKSKAKMRSILAAADYFLATGRYEVAKKHFEQVAQNPAHKLWAYASYRSAWCDYLSTKPDPKKDRQIAAKFIAINQKLAKKNNFSQGLVELESEILQDLKMVWLDLRQLKEARTYFYKQNQKEVYFQFLNQLAEIYRHDNRPDKAIIAYELIVKEDSTSPKLFKIHEKLVREYSKRADTAKITKILTEMPSTFMEDGNWRRRNGEQIAEASKVTENLISAFAISLEKTGTAKKNKVLLNQSQQLCQTYLKYFAKEANAIKVRYKLAKILENDRQYEMAAHHYNMIAKANKTYAKESTQKTVICLQRADAEMKQKKLPPPGQVTKAIPIPKLKLKLVDAIDQYNSKFENPQILKLFAAKTFFGYGHYQESIKRFDSLTRSHPKTKEAKMAIKMTFAYHSDRQNWNALMQTSKELLQSKEVMAAGHRKTLQSHHKNAILKLATAYRDGKRKKEAAQLYRSFADQYPKDKRADQSLFEAFEIHRSIGELDVSIILGKTLKKEYPKSKFLEYVHLKLAASYETLADFESAAIEYSAYALRYPRGKEAERSLSRAIRLNSELGNTESTKKLSKIYIARHPNTPGAGLVAYALGEIEMEAKDYKQAASAYKQSSRLLAKKNPSKAGQALSHAIVAESRLVNPLKARVQLTKAVRNHGKRVADNKSRTILASEMLRNLEVSYKTFAKIDISNQRNFQTNIKKKTDWLNNLKEDYQVLAREPGQFSLAALIRIGDLHEDFADELLQMSISPSTPAKQADKLRSSIEKRAFTLQEEAGKYYKAAFKRSKEIDDAGPWSRVAREKMSQIDSNIYPQVQTETGDPSFISHRLVWDPIVADMVH